MEKVIKKSFLLFSLFFFFCSVNQVKAGWWPTINDDDESWIGVECVASQCGSSTGTKSQTINCQEGNSDFEDDYCDYPSSKTISISCSDATITACPTSAPSSNSTANPPSAPHCNSFAPTKLAANFHIYRQGGDAIAKWFPTDGDKANIYYKQIKSNNWQYSVRDISNSGYYIIHDLGKLNITFALQQSNGCAGGPLTSPIIDGFSRDWILFR
jgi:hypothetical protein